MLPRLLARSLCTAAAASWNFGCTLCGRCCTLGKDRVVLLSAQEVQALERHAARQPSAFVQLTSDGAPSLKTDAGGACVFLDGGKKCGVYDVRPTMCRTYPFWGETTSPLGWLRESARCEGIGQGPAVPLSEVALNVIQTDLALAGETTTFEEDRSLLSAIPDVVMEQFEEQSAAGGVVRWDSPELCVVDSPDLQTGRALRTLTLKEAPSLSQSVAYLNEDSRVVPAELAMPVHRALALALILCQDARPVRILFIGGGGCSLPLAVGTLLPGASVTVVELSGDVADAARRFFIPDAPLKLVVADGAEFLRASPEVFDLIFVDAANATESPAPSLASDSFVDELHAKLTEHGMIAVNCFGDAASVFVSRVAARFRHGTAVMELAAEDASSRHTLLYAQKGWTQGVDAAQAWRARLLAARPASLCDNAARHAAAHLRSV